MQNIKFIDLFAGMGGLRLGFEQACTEKNLKPICVMTSEIKPAAVKLLSYNFEQDNMCGDITKVNLKDIPDFDYLLGGFPCQAFSTAGKQFGFADTRGTLFFEIERILEYKRPVGFILENVEGLLIHNKINKTDDFGDTFKTILNKLQALGYKVNFKLLNSKDFGVAQSRKRVFIVGTLTGVPDLEEFPVINSTFEQVMEQVVGKNTEFTNKLLEHYSCEDLYGKAFKDKRGGANNIHSWDIELKGAVSKDQKELLEKLLRERRQKKWSKEISIDWMDGIPLTLEQIKTFCDKPNLKDLLDDLVRKGYLVFEHPKRLVKTEFNNSVVSGRVPDENIPAGYNIVAGKLSYPFTVFVNPKGLVPTLTATDILRVGVVCNGTIRSFTPREVLRLFGYPDDYSVDCFDLESKKDMRELFDLFGNTVVVPVVKSVAGRVLDINF